MPHPDPTDDGVPRKKPADEDTPSAVWAELKEFASENSMRLDYDQDEFEVAFEDLPEVEPVEDEEDSTDGIPQAFDRSQHSLAHAAPEGEWAYDDANLVADQSAEVTARWRDVSRLVERTDETDK
jgi:hypothetical protein